MTVKGQKFPKKKRNKPAPPPDAPVPVSQPGMIAGDKDKERLWLFLVEDLKSRNQFSPTYTILIESLVEYIAARNEVLEDLRINGRQIPRYNKDGEQVGTMNNPSFDQWMKLEDKILKALEKLGMTPRDIVFLNPDKNSPDDVLEEKQEGIVYFR